MLWRVIASGVALLLILLGSTGLLMFPRLIQTKIEPKLHLKMDTQTYKRFVTVPIALTVKFYIFNVTNSDQVLQGLERPHFEEVGPFMYKQWRRRNVREFQDNNRKIKFEEYKTYYTMYPDSEADKPYTYLDINNVSTKLLNPAMTNVTIVNMPLLSVLTKLASLPEGSVKRNLAAMIAQKLVKDGRERILVSRAANEILFEGYRVSFFEEARKLVEDLGFNFESPLPGNKFGFFFMKNHSWPVGGEWTIYTGSGGSMNNFMQLDNWNGLKVLNVWPNNTEAGNRCNQIRGSDGSQFHPGVSKHLPLHVFSPLICTSVSLVFRHETSTRDIPLYRFGTRADTFAAPRKNPRNACYCTIPKTKSQLQLHQMQQQANENYIVTTTPSVSGSNNGKPSYNGEADDRRCYTDGLMDLSLCQKGAPIAASAPHFFNADPSLALAAGLKPDPERHDTFVDIEPMTGSVMRASSRAQLNAFVDQAALNVLDSDVVGNMIDMVAPLFWVEESAEIDEKSSIEFKGKLLSTVQKVKRYCVGSILLGVLVILGIFLLGYLSSKREKWALLREAKE